MESNHTATSAEEAVKIVKSGDRFWTPLSLGQPSVELMDALADRKHELEDVEYICALNLKPYKIFQPECRDTFHLNIAFYSPLTAPTFQRGESAFWPGQSSNAHQISLDRNRIYPRRTGMIVQVSPPDRHGYVTVGLDNFYTKQIMEQVDWAIAEINTKMPTTYGDTHLHLSQFDHIVENTSPLIALPTPEVTEVHKKMAQHVVGLIRDRDCLQVGIGAVPAMISHLIAESDLKDLGVHTEMAPADIHQLVDKGIVSGKYKTVDQHKVITAFALGDNDMYQFLGDNPMIEFHPTRYCNSITKLAEQRNLTAINGSIEVDLVGTICSESIGNNMHSGTGGQLDFVIGAYLSEGGRAINLLPSTAKNGTVSRIVPYLSDGARVTVPRHYAQYVVTEYGVADLSGRNEKERALALIDIAHPKFQDELMSQAKERLKF